MPQSNACHPALDPFFSFSECQRGYECVHEDANLAHITYSVFAVPEGFAISARCSVCGGRAEALTDLRLCARSDGERQRDLALINERFHATIESLVARLSAEHAGCVELPIEYTAPERLRRVMDAQLQLAGDLLSEGEEVSPKIILLLEDGAEIVRAIPGQLTSSMGVYRNAPSSKHFSHMAETLFAMREHARAEHAKVLGAMVIGECDFLICDHGKPKRRRSRQIVGGGLGVTVVTSTFAHSGLAPIARITEGSKRSPRFLGHLAMHPLTHGFLVVDGLYALAAE